MNSDLPIGLPWLVPQLQGRQISKRCPWAPEWHRAAEIRPRCSL